MAKYGVSLKIDVSKIDKARLFKGEKGIYLDATVFIDEGEADQYGNNGMITQDVTKDERANKVQGNILGNCKVFWRDDGAGSSGNRQEDYRGHTGSNQKNPTTEPADDFEDSIPF